MTVASWLLLLIGVLVAGCAIGGSKESMEQRPVRLPENLSFVWHDLSGAELDSPAVAVTRAAVESYFLSGQEGDLKGGYPGYEEFVDQKLIPGEPIDRHEGTIEFVLVKISSVEVDGRIEVDATFCYSKYGAARIADGRRYLPNHMLPAGRVLFSLDSTVSGGDDESSPWDSEPSRV